MNHKTAHTSRIRRAIIVTATSGALLMLGAAGPAHGLAPKGLFNCAMGPTVVPDDRWSSCAILSVDYCVVGPTAVPDDRWTDCTAN